MTRKRLSGLILCTIAFLVACSPNSTQFPATTPTKLQGAPEQTALLTLAEPGPYFAGNREYTYVDESRGGREINVTLYYPAIQQTNDAGQPVSFEAPPDMSHAPYPLILTESSSGSFVFKSHFATHGFVMARIDIPDHRDYSLGWDLQMIDWPRDFVFVLRRIASTHPAGLENVIDTERAGVTGYSLGVISPWPSVGRGSTLNFTYPTASSHPTSIQPISASRAIIK